MNTIRQELTDIVEAAIKTAFGVDMDPYLQIATRPEYGDYQANFALRLAKTLQQKPTDVAEKVRDLLAADTRIQSLTVSGPGFINITMANTYLAETLTVLAKSDRLGVATTTDDKTCVVDYGGANVAKEMHVGHSRSIIIGDAIVRLLEFLGYKVIKQNHLGDWGTQFGMLIEYLIDMGWRSDQPHAYSDLNAWYKSSKERFDLDPSFAERARQRVVALQGNDKETRAIWQHLAKESIQHFQAIYDRLGVKLTPEDVCGESFYNDQLATIVDELKRLQIASENEGAVVIFLPGFVDPDKNPLPLLIRKRDGGYLYATTDLAAIHYRLNQLHAKRIIYVVDARQKQHFDMVFAAAAKAGWVLPDVQLEHVFYGSVLGEDRKPLKTRSGENIKLSDVLHEAEQRARQSIIQKNPDLSAAEVASIASDIGMGALKYADLRSDKVKDYMFSFEKMLAFDGNTGPYLQNAYMRIFAIFRKGNIVITQLVDNQLHLDTVFEHQLAVKLASFADIVQSVAETLHLHVLCDYLYDIAGLFHRFYEHCPVLTDTNPAMRESRLLLCLLTAKTLKQGMNLLGINVLERM